MDGLKWQLYGVYPRVCGGSLRGWQASWAAEGLSPRVRGKRREGGCPPRHPGSIPACAGEAWTATAAWRGGKVYPRVCGGSIVRAAAALAVNGLSPRVRGKPPFRPRPPSRPRSIPACAGEASWLEPREGRSSVYPRVCGGSCWMARRMAWSVGLSPRVRGKLRLPPARRRGSRSIPACAGEARNHRRDEHGGGVYPRVCGGSSRTVAVSPEGRGLSPRVRGKQSIWRNARMIDRSIPACAGEAASSSRPTLPSPVYPRVCGGSTGVVAGQHRRQGLSPRVRGKRGYVLEAHARVGSIPACAGEALSGVGNCRKIGVYPRVCGGSALSDWSAPPARGLSPRVRGKPA